MRKITQEGHERFLIRFRKSQKDVRAVAWWFKSLGYTGTIMGYTEAPTPDVWAKHSDKGDLFVQRGHGPELRIEVKNITRNFTNRASWIKEFGHRFIVDGQGSYDRKNSIPYAYCCCSDDLTHVAVVVVCETRDEWKVEMISDGNNEGKEKLPFYTCNPKVVKFYQLPKEEKND